MTINTVWTFITLGCVSAIVGGVLHSLCTKNNKRIFRIEFDFVPLSIVLYVIGGMLGFVAIVCGCVLGGA